MARLGGVRERFYICSEMSTVIAKKKKTDCHSADLVTRGGRS